MANIISVGQPRNDAERQAIDYLRKHLPVTCTVMHNFEIKQGTEWFEIDLAVLTPQCVYVVDVKGVRGKVEVFGSKWYPEGRAPYNSPLIQGRLNAKILKSLLIDTHKTRPELQQVHVRATVLLTSSDVQLLDPEGRDLPDCVLLAKSLHYFQNKANVPSYRSTDIRSFLPLVEQTIRGRAKPGSAALIYRDWKVEEKLGGNERYTEYGVRHVFLGKRNTARLRVYRADPYQDEAKRQREQKVISNAYRAVGTIPGHPNIVNVREFFDSEDGTYFVLVTEDVHGEALRMHIKKPALALTFDQKLRVMRDVLAALEHAHSYQVIHRNLTPDSIIVSNDGHARLASFEYARAGASGTSSIAKDIVDDIDETYQSPECYHDPSQASVASDLFSAGLVFYELITGEQAFSSPAQIFDVAAIFPVDASAFKTDLPAGLDTWLQTLCAFKAEDRFISATEAHQAFERIIMQSQPISPPHIPPTSRVITPSQTQDKKNLPRDYILDGRFIVQERLGQGGFATVYKVFDSLAEVMHVLKLVLTDRVSVYQRLRQEYKTLSNLPSHPYVVKVTWAGQLADSTPYIVFEFIDGLNVENLVRERALTLEDAIKIAEQVADGLAHLHKNNVYHQDIKPSNLLWTDQGVRIIDFNVAVSGDDSQHMPGGTERYTPPDQDNMPNLSVSQKIERDIYALGITFYECVTGQYPFQEPKLRKHATSPYAIEGCHDLHSNLVEFLLKAIAPNSSERFLSIAEFLSALRALLSLPSLHKPVEPLTLAELPLALSDQRTNYNPYVRYLMTLYSQSQHTNAGTRGLDSVGEKTYVPTLLDLTLQPAILAGDFQLVIVSGNAGDGKTAFIQQVAMAAKKQGAQVQHYINGYTFELHERTFVSNFDGSQDEEEKANNQVLLEFFAPFVGKDESQWNAKETRLIAINEGRLVDFLAEHQQQFPRLSELVREGLEGLAGTSRVSVINLNLRAVIADHNDKKHNSIFDRLLRRMLNKELWDACTSCDLKARCYVHHNARTLIDPVAGARSIERLKTLYTITHLRGQLHVTLRDLRSALAYMLVGTKDCDDIHNLYQSNSASALQQILDGFYFNSWMGGTQPNEDRLISLLREIDVGEASNPHLDRSFDFLKPTAREMARYNYSGRDHYDDELLQKVFIGLPREYTEKTRTKSIERHRAYVSMMRRRYYFECRNEEWRHMLPYQHFEDFHALIMQGIDPAERVKTLLQAVNRGEGLTDPVRLGSALALRVRRVDRGTIQSYRLFDGQSFTLSQRETRGSTRFVEYLSQALYLQYQSQGGQKAELRINLDVYEMLMRLYNGYRPSPEELQGFYLSLIIFKNVLASAPYQEVLLTETGHEFFKIRRNINGTLSLEQML